jgi:hypothetical protein
MKDFKNWLFEQIVQTEEDYETAKRKLEKMLLKGIITQEDFDKQMRLAKYELEVLSKKAKKT